MRFLCHRSKMHTRIFKIYIYIYSECNPPNALCVGPAGCSVVSRPLCVWTSWVWSTWTQPSPTGRRSRRPTPLWVGLVPHLRVDNFWKASSHVPTLPLSLVDHGLHARALLHRQRLLHLLPHADRDPLHCHLLQVRYRKAAEDTQLKLSGS